MNFLRPLTIALCIFIGASSLSAQSLMPNYFINADIGYAFQKIPMLGVEHFVIKNDHVRSWHLDIAYQFHYKESFGIKNNKNDYVSVGVYRGPGIKLGYTFYTRWVDRKWKNYISPTLGIKYLQYDKLQVNIDPIYPNPAFRIQSEECLALVPQFYFGQKRFGKHLCLDYYVGAQLPVKFRNKRVYYEQNNLMVANPDVPYNRFEIAMLPDIVVGIKVGFISYKKIPQKVADELKDQYRKRTHYKSNKKRSVFLFE